MKKLFLLVSLLAAAATASAQHGSNIKTNLASLVSVYWEYGLSDKMSVQGGLCYDVLLAGTGHVLKAGFGGGVHAGGPNFSIPIEARYYFTSPPGKLVGFHVGPYVKFKYLDYHADGGDGFLGGWWDEQLGAENRETSLGIGLNLGYQGNGRGGLVYDASFGLGYKVFDNATYLSDWDGWTKRTNLPYSLRFGLMLGYRLE